MNRVPHKNEYLNNRRCSYGFFIKVLAGFLVLMVFTRCAREGSTAHFELKPVSKQVFPMNAAMDPISFAMFAYEWDGPELFIYLNDLDNSLLIFDLQHSKLLNEIRFDLEGENGVGVIGGFCYVNPDSIWLTPESGHGRLYLANSHAQVLNKFDFSEVPDFLGNSYLANSEHPLVISHSELFTLNYHRGPWNELPLEEYSKMSMGMKMNLKTGEMTSLPARFPLDYWSEFKFPLYFSRVSDGERMMYLFSYADKIYSHSFDEATVSVVKQVAGIGPFKKVKPTSIYESMVNTIRNPQNMLLLYDKYRKVYYLIYYPGDSEIKIEDYDTRELAMNLPHCEILVLDENFDQLTTYQSVRSFQYRINNAFVGKEGLYVSMNNAFNPEMDEDYLSFQLFELEKN